MGRTWGKLCLNPSKEKNEMQNCNRKEKLFSQTSTVTLDEFRTEVHRKLGSMFAARMKDSAIIYVPLKLF